MDCRFGGRSSTGWSWADEGGDEDEDDAHGGGRVVAIRWKEMDLAWGREKRRRGGGFDGRRGMGSLAVKRRREMEVVAAEAIGEYRKGGDRLVGE